MDCDGKLPANVPLQVVNIILENPDLFPPKPLEEGEGFDWEEPQRDDWAPTVAVILADLPNYIGNVIAISKSIAGKDDTASEQEQKGEDSDEESEDSDDLQAEDSDADDQEAEDSDPSSEKRADGSASDVRSPVGVDGKESEVDGSSIDGDGGQEAQAPTEADMESTHDCDGEPCATGVHSRGTVEALGEVRTQCYSRRPDQNDKSRFGYY